MTGQHHQRGERKEDNITRKKLTLHLRLKPRIPRGPAVAPVTSLLSASSNPQSTCTPSRQKVQRLTAGEPAAGPALLVLSGGGAAGSIYYYASGTANGPRRTSRGLLFPVSADHHHQRRPRGIIHTVA